MGNLTDHFSGGGGGSNILEELIGPCDGNSMTVSSGTYTFPNVTSITGLGASNLTIPGSEISYTAPEGATKLLYSFEFKIEQSSYSGISHYKILVDNTEVAAAYRDFAFGYISTPHSSDMFRMHYVFDLTAASDDIANGKFNGWSSPKTIKVTGREYDGSTYQVNVNANHYRDGAGASGIYEVAKPILTIKAYK